MVVSVSFPARLLCFEGCLTHLREWIGLGRCLRVQAVAEEVFDTIDKNGDGTIDVRYVAPPVPPPRGLQPGTVRSLSVLLSMVINDQHGAYNKPSKKVTSHRLPLLLSIAWSACRWPSCSQRCRRSRCWHPGSCTGPAQGPRARRRKGGGHESSAAGKPCA